jgi:hypothetical protein
MTPMTDRGCSSLKVISAERRFDVKLQFALRARTRGTRRRDPVRGVLAQ